MISSNKIAQYNKHGLAMATMKVWNSKVVHMQSINPNMTTQNTNTTTHGLAMATTKMCHVTKGTR